MLSALTDTGVQNTEASLVTGRCDDKSSRVLTSESHQGLKLETMRQKENLETFLESLLLSEDTFKTDAGGNTHTSLPPLSHIQRSVNATPGNK